MKMKYNDAKNLFETARDKTTGKPLENNTRLIKTDKGYGIKLHNTVVVEILSGDKYILNTGGWQTVTTKDRINNYSPARLWQQKSIWYINTEDSQKIAYEDGMKIDKNGNPTDLKTRLKKLDKIQSKNKKLDKILKKYIDGFCQLIKDKKLKDPSGGDCWFCCMFNTDDTNHLFSHFKENYFVPSLLLNAFKEAGYAEPGFIWHFCKNGESYHARSALRKYFKKRRMSLLAVI
jgi:hypothetical protein